MLPLRLSEIASLVGGDLVGDTDPVLSGVAALDQAGPTDLSFVRSGKEMAQAAVSKAGGLLVGRDVVVDKPRVEVDDPYLAFSKVLARAQIEHSRVFPAGIHPTAVIDPEARVDETVAIGPYCVIGPGAAIGAGTCLGSHVSVGCDVTIGRGCLIYAQVVIREGCRLGNHVIVHAAAVLGSDGFGYLPGPEGQHKIPQVGIVEVEDNVEIGAGSTIDRATTGRTLIGAGSKIDNQVQIAHNVHIGQHCALSAQVGIAGSSVLGAGVIFGGQVGVVDHVEIGAGVQAGGQTGIIGNLQPGQRVFGTPAQDVRESLRAAAAARRVPELLVTVRQLKKEVAELSARLAKAEGRLGQPGHDPDQNQAEDREN